MKEKDYFHWMNEGFSRRRFIASTTLAGMSLSLDWSDLVAGNPGPDPLQRESIIDIHQHLAYSGRTDEQLIAHQEAMGVTTTILLPSGRPLQYGSTYYGHANGLQGGTAGNEACYAFSQRHPGHYISAANEVPDFPEATSEIEKYLKLGAPLIGEQKFGVECDSPEMQKLYSLAQAYDVPVLMHWQHGMYNRGLERFHKMLEKFPDVNFIGHAQTWWANIDRNHKDQNVLYPKTRVTPGGLTDRLLSDYPNMYGDLSAGSGLNSLLRDEDHARGFIERHQNKLMFGSDCSDAVGHGVACQGSQTLVAIRRLSPDKTVVQKILYQNAKKLFRL